jgi:error-prone DNA polymerase
LRLLAYASSWLKCHEPAAFLCALLNSQPMGFYSPSQLVQDAQRHGIEVRPVDIAISGWESTLEELHDTTRQPAVRLGLSLQRGMSREAAARIEDARAIRPFESVADLARRAGWTAATCRCWPAPTPALARRAPQGSAVAGGGRRARQGPAAPDHADEEMPVLAAPSEGDEIVGDYRAQGLTLGRHPLALLRAPLLAQRFMPASV